MTLWRVEWLRLVRTGRVWALLGVYALFGVIGPLGARYLPELIEQFGGGIEIVVPDPTPLDGMGQFLSNASQIGLLVVIAVAASALSFDSRPPWSAFLRTRVRSTSRLVVPRTVASTVAAALALVVGSVLAAVVTGALIGPPAAGDVALGTVFGVLYLAFAVSVVAVAASVTRQTVSTVLLTVGLLVVLPVLQALPVLEPWLPSRLAGATTELLAGTPASELLRSAVVAVLSVPALHLLASRRLDRREPTT